MPFHTCLDLSNSATRIQSKTGLVLHRCFQSSDKLWQHGCLLLLFPWSLCSAWLFSTYSGLFQLILSILLNQPKSNKPNMHFSCLVSISVLTKLAYLSRNSGAMHRHKVHFNSLLLFCLIFPLYLFLVLLRAKANAVCDVIFFSDMLVDVLLHTGSREQRPYRGCYG